MSSYVHAGEISPISLDSLTYLDGDKYRFKYSLNNRDNQTVKLEEGDLVLGRIKLVTETYALVIIEKCLNKNMLITAKCLLPIAKISKLYIKNLREHLAVSDAILAKIAGVDKLTIVEDNLGIILGHCTNCNHILETIEGAKAVCPHCHTINVRKFSTFYGANYMLRNE